MARRLKIACLAALFSVVLLAACEKSLHEKDERYVFVATDNFRAGLKSGRLVADVLHQHGRVVLLTIHDQYNLDERLRGVQEELKKYPYVTFYKVYDDRGDPQVAEQGVSEILQNKE